MSVVCSIVIPSFNTRELTVACIEHLRTHPLNRSFEIIVVDNNSIDGTFDEVTRRFPDIRPIHNPANLGFSKACNRGARKASGNFLCFLNSDTQASGQALDRLIDWLMEHPSTGMAGPQLLGPEGRLLQMSWAWDSTPWGEFRLKFLTPRSVQKSRFKQRLVRYLQRRPRHVPVIMGASVMMRRDVFEALGGFDEQFELYFEDSDLCLRCRQAGYAVDFVSDAHVLHHLGRSNPRPWNLASVIYRQSQLYYYRKHAFPGSVLLLRVFLSLKWLKIWVTFIRRREDRPLIRNYLARLREIILAQKHWKPADGNYFSSLQQR